MRGNARLYWLNGLLPDRLVVAAPRRKRGGYRPCSTTVLQ